MILDFQFLLHIYETELENIRLKLAKKMLTKKEAHEAKGLNHYWFSEMKVFSDWCDYFDYITADQFEKYNIPLDLIDKYQAMCPKLPLCAIVRYRNIEVPVFDDDYGQQEVVKIGDMFIGCGAYNWSQKREIASEIDIYLEEQYMATPVPQEEIDKPAFFSEIMAQEEKKDV